MKKFVFIMSALLLGMFVFTACEKDKKDSSKKATEQTVLKYLPGKWKIATEVDADGEKMDVKQSIIYTFGEEGVDVPEAYGTMSSIAGKYSMEHNGNMIVHRGRWNIEPVAGDPGVFTYLHADDGELMNLPNGEIFFFIETINDKSMQIIMDEDSPEGYILNRVN